MPLPARTDSMCVEMSFAVPRSHFRASLLFLPLPLRFEVSAFCCLLQFQISFPRLRPPPIYLILCGVCRPALVIVSVRVHHRECGVGG